MLNVDGLGLARPMGLLQRPGSSVFLNEVKGFLPSPALPSIPPPNLSADAKTIEMRGIYGYRCSSILPLWTPSHAPVPVRCQPSVPAISGTGLTCFPGSSRRVRAEPRQSAEKSGLPQAESSASSSHSSPSPGTPRCTPTPEPAAGKAPRSACCALLFENLAPYPAIDRTGSKPPLRP